MDSRGVGVDAEFLLVEPEAGTDLAGVLRQQQLETNSRPCQSLEELHRELRRCRAKAATAALPVLAGA